MRGHRYKLTRAAVVAASVHAVFSVPGAWANPTGPQVVKGQAGVSRPNASTLNVTNSSGAIINWQGFSIGVKEVTRFIQPSAASAVLNRVVGPDISSLQGQLLSNGRVFLINPAGIVIGPGAMIDTAGFVGSTLNMQDADFLAGKLKFQGDANSGRIVNQGWIKTAAGGQVILVAPQIENNGLIQTPNGQIILAAGKSLTITSLDHEGVQFEVQAPTDAVLNVGKLLAEGGAVRVFAGSLQHSGEIRATSLSTDATGQIVLQADVLINTGSIRADGERGGSVAIQARNMLSAGRISADGSNGAGGEVNIQASGGIQQTSAAHLSANGEAGGGKVTLQAVDRVFGSGTLTASGTGAGSTGGEIKVLANDIVLLGARLDASGDAGGGTILVGGDFQGKNPDVQNATTNWINFSTTINADARSTGNGGKVIVWSDEETKFYGSVSARGGAQSGDGGFMEISGKETLTMGGFADAGAPNGKSGTLLLDPKFIIIDSAGGGGLSSFLLVDPNPSTSDQFAQHIVVLANDNVVATDPFDDLVALNAGAVYLFNGTTGALISTLSGSTADNNVGSGGVVALVGNGNYVVTSPGWDSATAANVGAVTWGSGTTGISGTVSATNSLVGTTLSDQVGNGREFGGYLNGVTALSNGNYVVRSVLWDIPAVPGPAVANVGAVTWGDGSTAGPRLVGEVSAANSLVGTTLNDRVGSGGEVTVSPGTQLSDAPGLAALSNGNYVVVSPMWNNPAVGGSAGLAVGAATWVNGTNGHIAGTILPGGAVSAINSLVGTSQNANVGANGVTALIGNGNYVVASPWWRNGAAFSAGAATWGDGSTAGPRLVGPVTAANSLVGLNAGDNVGQYVTALSNGNYVVGSPGWANLSTGAGNAGAVTWGDGSTAGTRLIGAVSAANSLVGTTSSDEVGQSNNFSGVVALSNGNYVVASSLWNIPAIPGPAVADVGAVTWGDGSTAGPRLVGAVSATNSLVGTSPSDQVGFSDVNRPGVTALTNGNYVVRSRFWDNTAAVVFNAGAATWGDGSTAGPRLVGDVSAANSLVGTIANSGVAFNGVKALSNGNYVVSSLNYDGGALGNPGAVTWGDGAVGTVGAVTTLNSLFGTVSNDNVGVGPGLGVVDGVTALTNGNYVVISRLWNVSRGAATWGDGSTAGPRLVGAVSATNSLVGGPANGSVGAGGVTALANGNYVVDSFFALTGGSTTWGSGTTGISGTVSLLNSLVGRGSISGLSNGNFVLSSTLSASGAGLVHVVVPPSGGGAFSNPLGFADNAAGTTTITPAQITAITNLGTAVTLQASSDITLAVASNIISNNTGGDGGALTLQAGRSILLNSSITTDNGALTLIANDNLASGVVDAQRGPGAAVIAMAAGTTLNAGSGNVSITLNPGTGLTNNTSGDITLANLATTTGNIFVNALAAGSNVNLGGVVSKTGGGNAGFEVRAANNILLGATAGITSAGAQLNVTLGSDSDASGGGSIQMAAGSSIATNGGSVVMGGGANPLTGYAQGSGVLQASASGIYIAGDISAGAGNVTLHGRGAAGFVQGDGVALVGGTLSSNGTVIIDGIAQAWHANPGCAGVCDFVAGVHFAGTGVRLATATGTVNVTGVNTQAGTRAQGVTVEGATIETTGSGTLTLNGTATPLPDTNWGIGILFGGTVRTTAGGGGALTLTGTASPADGGVVWADGNVTSGGGEIRILAPAGAIGSLGAGSVLGGPNSGNILMKVSDASPIEFLGGSVNAGTSALTLSLAGGSANGYGNPIAAGAMRLLGNGTINLGGSGNNIGTLAANVTGPLSYRNSGALTVGSVTSFDGAAVTTTNGVTTTGNAALTADAGGITMVPGTTINAGAGKATLTAGAGGGNIVVESITAADVELQQNGGTSGSSILRASGSSLITATHLLMEVDLSGVATGGSIGTAAAPMRVQVSNLEAHTHEASPGIFIDSPTQGLTIGGVPFFLGSVKGVQNVASGDISVTANGNLIALAGTAGCGSTGGTGGPVCSAGSITLAAGNGELGIHNVITHTGAGPGSLNARASNNILVGSGANISSGGGPFNITLNSDSDANGAGAISFGGANSVNSNGGNILLAGGVGAADFAMGTALNGDGILLGNVSVNSGAGSITMRGTGQAASANATGIRILGASSVSSTSGAINLTGIGGAGTSGNHGIRVSGAGSMISTGAGSITLLGTSDGTTNDNVGLLVESGGVVSAASAISMTGTGGSGSGSDNVGIKLAGSGTTVQTTGSGNIMLVGIGGLGSDNNNGVRVDNSAVIASAGTLSVSGIGDGSGAGNSGLKLSGAGSALQSVGLLTLIGAGGSGLGDNNDGVRLEGGNVSSAGPVIVDGIGGTGGNDAVGIKLGAATIQSTGGGVIMLFGQGGSGADNNNGVRLESGALISTSTSITIDGTADGIGDNNSGVKLSGGTVQSTGAGIVTLTGRGAAGINSNDGVRLESAAMVTVAGGSIVIDGAGGAGSGINNFGVLLNGSSAQSSGGGNLTITGQGGNGGTNENYGILLNASTVSSTGGTVQVSGTGGTGSGITNLGLFINGGSVQTAGSGSILLTGQAGAGTNGNTGVTIGTGANINAANGAIVITGTGAGTGTGNAGVSLSNSTVASTGAQSIEVNGSGAGVSVGVQTFGGTLGGASHSGDLIVRARPAGGGDGVDLAGAMNGSGRLFLEPLDASTTIGIAGGAGTLNLSAAELGMLANGFSQITIGHPSGTGLISVGSHAFNDPIIIRNTGTGSAGIVTGGALAAGANDLNLFSAGLVNVTEGTISGANIGISAGSLLVQPGVSALSPSLVNATGNLTVNANAVTIRGSDTAAGLTAKLQAGGTVTLNANAGSVSIEGGNMPGASASIDPPVAVINTTSLSLTGGSGIGSFAELAAGTVTVNGGNVTLAGGAAADTYALIHAVSGILMITAPSGVVSLTQGTGTNANAAMVASLGAAQLSSAGCTGCTPLLVNPIVGPSLLANGIFGNPVTVSVVVPPPPGGPILPEPPTSPSDLIVSEQRRLEMAATELGPAAPAEEERFEKARMCRP